MGFLSGKKEKANSVVLEKLDKGRQITTKQFDYLFCTGVALFVGYIYAKLNM
jgi:hypothetical protein